MSDSQTQTITLLHRPFLDIFSDSIRFANLALVKDLPPDVLSCMIKASIIHSGFAIESAANCFLDSLNFSKRLLEAFDRFQPIEKFDLILSQYKPNLYLDRGAKQIQRVQEIFKVRNNYVHPKSRLVVGDYAGENIEIEGDKTEFLQIPNEANRWSYVEAKKTIIAACDFYEYFFIDLCGLSALEISFKLFGLAIDNEEFVKLFIVEEHRQLLRKAETGMNIKFRFLDINTPLNKEVDLSYKSK